VDRRLRRALVRVVGATAIVVGVTVTASAVRRADQVVASGREVLMGDRLVDTFVGGDMSVVRNVETAGIVVALGDLAVSGGSLRIERASARVFAVGGSLAVGDDASIILPATGELKYGTIRTGAPGSPDTVTRDPNAVSAFTPMVAALESSAKCFAATATSGIVTRDGARTTFLGDGVSPLQVFKVTGRLVGSVQFDRVPPDATVLINVEGEDVAVSPTSDEWTARSNDILVNAPTATSVTVDAADGRMINLLVGNPESYTSVEGELYRGRMLTLGELELFGTRVEAGRLTATHLPECRSGDAAARADPAGASITAVPNASPSTSSSSSSAAPSSTTSPSTSTTTTTMIVARPVPAGDPVVLGAAFSLGGAATSTKWWIGLPVSLLGLLLLTSSWITPVLTASRPAVAIRRIVRAGRPIRRARRATRR
jgi:choice-of-anchor A domain-containing protein